MLKQSERLFKAAADRTRLRILKMLESGPLCVCQIVETLGLSQSAVSRHLALLSAVDLVDYEPKGKWTFYRLSRPRAREVAHLQAAIRCLGEGDPVVAADLTRVAAERVRSLAPRCSKDKAGKGGTHGRVG